MKKVKTKLLYSYLLLILFILIIGSFSAFGFNKLNDNGQSIYDDRLLPVVDLTKVVEYSSDVRLQMVQAILRQDPSNIETVLKEVEEVDSYIASYAKSTMHSEEAAAFEAMKADWEIYKNRVDQNTKFIAAGDYTSADEGIKLGKPEYISFSEKLNTLLKINEETAQNLITDNQSTYKVTIITQLILMVLALLTAIGISLLLGNSITKAVNTVLKRVQQIADGDLTGNQINVKTKDEFHQLADGINLMQASLNTLVLNAAQTAEQLSASSEELYASAEQSTMATEQVANLAQESSIGAEKQLSSVNSVANSIELFSNSIQQIASNSDEMSKMSHRAGDFTAKGAKDVKEVVQQMHVIADIVNKLARLIENLNEKSKDIGNITNIITNISEQTNLLALNAAIEAARAGEQGKGFAVVADEVRKLAEESKKSASQITAMLKEIQNETSLAVVFMNQGTEKVDEGIKLSDTVSISFADLQEIMSAVSEKINVVSSEISGMVEVSDHIISDSEEVKEIAEKSVFASQESSAATEEQLATMEEISASAQALSSLAEDLQQMIMKFKV